MKILLIYESIPEQTQIYLLNVVDEDILTKIKSCHGCYCNLEDTPEDHPVNNFLPEYLANTPKECEIFNSHNKVTLPIDIKEPCILVHSGFML